MMSSRKGTALRVLLMKGVCFGLLSAGVTPQLALAADEALYWPSPTRPLSAHERDADAAPIDTKRVGMYRPRRANFAEESASPETRQVADWVVDAGDNGSLPFMIVDKIAAKVFMFHADGRLRGATPALLGAALGDDSVPGIGDRPLASIHPDERTTPTGRFVAALDRNLHGKEMLWVDYDTAISLHPVVTSYAKEHRALRLATPSTLDNRISYGCINVPMPFFKGVVSPAFKGSNGIVYILPETRSLQSVFALYDVDERERLHLADQGVTPPGVPQIEARLEVQ